MPPGAAPLTLRFRAGGGTLDLATTSHAAARQPGLQGACAHLQRLVRAASGGAVPCGWGEPPPFVPDPGDQPTASGSGGSLEGQGPSQATAP